MGYTDRAGIDSRANSALLRVDSVIHDYEIPSAVRLALVAEIMAGEPILTDRESPAAFTVRAELARYHAGRECAGTRLLRELRNARGIDA
jgi:hypothetical protein